MIFDYINRNSALPFEQRVAQNFTSELQWSPNLTMGFVFSGELNLHYAMHNRQFKEHDIFFFLPMQSFSIIDSTPDSKILYITTDSDYIAQLWPDVSHMNFSQNHLQSDLANPIYVEICHDLATIIFNNLKNEVTTKATLLMAATHIVSVLFDKYSVISEDNKNSDVDISRSVEILKYVASHYTEDISAAQLANHLGLHPQYFSSYFKKSFQMNFIEYLNTYRINQSFYDLCYTNKSIINIALTHGFNSHKTYATMFKKLYHLTPMEYRKAHGHSHKATVSEESPIEESVDSSAGTFGFFRQFITTDSATQDTQSILAKARHQQVISLNVNTHASRKLNFSYKIISVGRAFACLRSEVQQQIRQAKKEFDFTYLRFRDIFSDDLYIYYENENKEPLFSWQTLDNVFDFVLSIGAKPFPEIGYMPEFLASKRQYAGLNYHPNVSAPKSIELWQNLVRQFLSHYVDRYGLAEVETWMFSFWTSPDLPTQNAYWNETMEEFFQFYESTYRVFQEISPSLKLGTPNFSTITGFPWYEQFFQFCYVKHIYPAFVDFHAYGTKLHNESAIKDSYLSINSANYTISDKSIIHEHISVIHEIMNRSGFRSLDLIISDWNLSFLPKDLIRDTAYMGPFICHTIFHSIDKVRAMCFWTLSDIHEDSFPESRPFTGGPGMLDYHGLRKASYNTIFLLTKLGRHVLEVGSNYLLAEENNRYQLIIYNLADFDDMFSIIDQSALDEAHRYQIYNSSSLYVHFEIKISSGTYYIKKSEVNRHYGSAYDIWNEMGAPIALHKEMEDYLRDNSVPHVTFTVMNVENTLTLDEEVPAHGVLLIELIPKE